MDYIKLQVKAFNTYNVHLPKSLYGNDRTLPNLNNKGT